MKFSERWLREWIDPPLDSQGLADALTGAGLEVDSVTTLAGGLDGVVLGQVLEAVPHPDADRLRLCSVDVGAKVPATIVCGAPNARAGLWAPVALPGTRLPGGMKIRRSRIRGQESNGMLCSAGELGLGEDVDGLLELDPVAAPGTAISEVLELDDAIIDVDLTPNRGDCLYLEGIARDVAAVQGVRLAHREVPEVAPASQASLAVRLDAPEACARYVGRVILGVNPDACTPLWMREKLRRCGVRSLSPVVDITNYVMLELGHPMHAFDLDALEGGIHVRHARADETVRLLDDSEQRLEPQDLVIADEAGAVALAGVMGGARTAVGDRTVNVYFECAWFAPRGIGVTARRLGLHTDASHRFERGVNPQGQMRAVERATALLLELCGGEAGPLVDTHEPGHLPAAAPIRLRASRIRRLLGVDVPSADVTTVLRNLHLEVTEDAEGQAWQVVPPPYRPDLGMEADLIEEIVRVRGYDSVPEQVPTTPLTMRARSEAHRDVRELRRILVARGFQEAITYSFVDKELQAELDGSVTPIPLSNPISSDMDVMRTSLIPGLLQAAIHNLNRERARVRLFEIGLVFRDEQDGETQQRPRVALLAAGTSAPRVWEGRARDIDVLDLKGDLEALVGPRAAELDYGPCEHPALRPGQCARVRLGETALGVIGALHPAVAAAHRITVPVVLLELELTELGRATVPRFAAFSRYPSVRRDLSLVVDEAVSVASLAECVAQAGGDVLKNLELFDLYRGEGIDSGRKSLSLALTLQDASRTLDDSDADAIVKAIVHSVASQLGGSLRG